MRLVPLKWRPRLSLERWAPWVLSVVLCIAVAGAFLIPVAGFFRQNILGRVDFSRHGAREVERLVGSELERLRIVADLLEDDRVLKLRMTQVLRDPDPAGPGFVALSNRLTDFLQYSGLSFAEIVEPSGKVFVNSGLESRFGRDVSAWAPVRETSRERRFRGLARVDGVDHLVVTATLFAESGYAGTVVVGRRFDETLLDAWATSLRTHLVLSEGGRIISSSLSPTEIPLFARSLARVPEGIAEIAGKPYAVARVSLAEFGAENLGVSVISSTAEFERGLKSIVLVMSAAVTPLVLAALALVVVIARRLQRHAASVTNANELLRAANSRLEILLGGVSAMASAQGLPASLEAFLESAMRAARELDTPGLRVDFWFGIRMGQKPEESFFAFERSRGRWNARAAEALPPPAPWEGNVCEIHPGKVVLRSARAGSSVGAVLVFHVSQAKIAGPELDVLTSLLHSLTLIATSALMAQRERAHLLELVGMAARISDRVNSPLLVVENALARVAARLFDETAAAPESHEALRRHVRLMEDAVSVLRSTSRELADLRERGEGIEATRSLFVRQGI